MPPTRLFLWAVCAALLVAPDASAQLRGETVITGLTHPVAFIQDPGDATIQYVVEQEGRIRIARNFSLLSTPFLDL